MISSSPVSIAVIGCGAWGPNHARVFNALPESRLVAVADTDLGKLERMGKLYPGLRLEADYRRLLEDASIEAVVVATPTQTHYRIVKEVLATGKHVLCEKPLCVTVTEAQELAEQRQKVLMVGHVFLFNPGLLKVKELIDAGEIGSVRYLAAVRTNLGPIRSDVNAAYDLAAHDIAIFNWLLGAEPAQVHAMGAAFLQPDIEDVVIITMKYPGNVLASIQCSWLDPKKVRQITIVGSKRMITWDDLALSNPVAIYEKKVETSKEITDYGEFLRLSMLDGDVHLPKVQVEEPLKAQGSAFIRAIRESKTPCSDGAFAVGVVRALSRVADKLRQAL